MGEPVTIDSQKAPYFTSNMSFTTVFNMTGNPVVVLPMSQSKEGLPIGVQVVGQRWSDMALLAVAEKISEIAGDFQAPPNF